MVTTWDRIKAFFKDSLTILWARIQYVGGVIGAGLVVAFSNYDFTQLTTVDMKTVVHMLLAVAVAGILTELARRRTL